MKKFAEYLLQQMIHHPAMQVQDVVKVCYQAACGAEHLLEDLDGAWASFEEEFQQVPIRKEPLYEHISEHVIRVNMSPWKQSGMPKEWLFRMFTGTVFSHEGKRRLRDHLEAAEELMYRLDFYMEPWERYLKKYLVQGMPPVRHSDFYRGVENPAYRIVDAAYLPLFPILERAAQAQRRPYVILVDGRAGAGKSTLASRLQRVLAADMVYMDDFFLPPALRTPQRLAEAGGNIHYERFAEQVLPCLSEDRAFSYEVFDCSRMELNGRREVGSGAYCIVEGSYSMHPKFGDYGDLRVFVDTDPDTQLQRIIARNGEDMAERFRTQWIPMENRYFETFQIPDHADIIIR